MTTTGKDPKIELKSEPCANKTRFRVAEERRLPLIFVYPKRRTIRNQPATLRPPQHLSFLIENQRNKYFRAATGLTKLPRVYVGLEQDVLSPELGQG